MSLLNTLKVMKDAGLKVGLEYIGDKQQEVTDRALKYAEFSDIVVGDIVVGQEGINDCLYVENSGVEFNGVLLENDLKHFKIKQYS